MKKFDRKFAFFFFLSFFAQLNFGARKSLGVFCQTLKFQIFMKFFLNATFSVILVICGAFIFNTGAQKCNECGNDLQKVISQIKQRAKLKDVLLIQEQYFNSDTNSNERKILWQGGFSYCDGKCFAVVTVTGHCFLGYC